MKKLTILFFSLFTYSSFCQSHLLEAKGYPPTLYFSHTVAGNETLLSLSVQYRLSPNTLSGFNSMSLGAVLTVGQVLKIPVTKTNLSDPLAKIVPSEVLVPLTITFSDNSSVKKTANIYNLSDSLLTQWNPGINTNIIAGTRVIIGYIRTKNRLTKTETSPINPNTTQNGQSSPNDKLKVVDLSSTNRSLTESIAATTTEKTQLFVEKQQVLKPVPGETANRSNVSPTVLTTNGASETAGSSPTSTNSTGVTPPINKQLTDSLAALSSDALFKLARAAAFDNKDYSQALQLCQIALVKSPTYNDIRIFVGRIYNWSGKADSARLCFETALTQEPTNLDAFLAYVDLENWNDRPEHALVIADSGLLYHPQSSQLLLKKARLLVGLNRTIPANAILDTLLKTDPSNTAARALSVRLRNEASGNAIGVTYDYYYFDKQFSDPWHLLSLDYRRQTSIGSMGAHINYANRFRRSGVQYEVDGYPRIMKHLYAYFSLAYSTDVGVFAKYRGGSSLYISLPKSYEAEVGFRYLYFSSATWIYTVAAGKYYKNWYFLARTYLTPGNQNISQSYNITGRYYFGGANDFIALTLGTGLSPDESRSDVLLNSNYKLITRKISSNYRHLIKNKYILSLSAGWVNQEYRPKNKGNQIDAGIGWQVRF